MSGHVTQNADADAHDDSVWHAISVLPPNTRLALSVGLLAFAYLGLKLSDKLQEEYPDEQHMPSLQAAGATPTTNGSASALVASKAADEKSGRLV